VLLLTALALGAAPAGAQLADATDAGYRREVYQYPRTLHPDPFRPLPAGRVAEASSVEELVLRGVVHAADPRHSVAILVEPISGRRIRARIGQRFGPFTVAGIQPRRVDLRVEDGGAVRLESLHLRPPSVSVDHQ
jgi:hypothetical protein